MNLPSVRLSRDRPPSAVDNGRSARFTHADSPENSPTMPVVRTLLLLLLALLLPAAPTVAQELTAAEIVKRSGDNRNVSNSEQTIRWRSSTSGARRGPGPSKVASRKGTTASRNRW